MMTQQAPRIDDALMRLETMTKSFEALAPEGQEPPWLSMLIWHVADLRAAHEAAFDHGLLSRSAANES